MSSHLEESIFGDADHLTSKGRFERRRRKPSSRGRGLRRLLTLVVALALLAGAAYGSLQFIRPIYDKITASNDFPGPGSGSAKVVVASGDTGVTIGAALEKAGVVKTKKAFVDAASADTKAAASIQPGTYTLRKEMKAVDALVALTDAKNRFVARVTVREGLWASETYPILSKASGIPVASYVQAAKNAKAIGLPAAARGNVEGWLFPSTYEFPDKSTPTQQLRAMVAKTVEELQKAQVDAASYQTTLIVASIVEAEANQKADLPKVARVIDNRVANKGAPNFGLLQFDSTVSYGAKRRSITTTNAERAADNPWNTYKRQGLPAGPISNPGAAAIAAAAHPAAGPWLFFVAVNPETGETKFAVTLQEHAVNVAQFQAWCQSHKGKC